jgi:DNA-binding HxlR family transcriptional regulator
VPRRSYHQTCSLARALEIVGERWTLLILRDMWISGPRQFDKLQRHLKVARNILTDRLDTLVEGGVVERRLYQTRPDRYEYLLSAAGEELVPALLSIVAWGDRHLAGPEGPPMLFDHGDHPVDPVTVCATCGEPVAMRGLTPVPGPGSAGLRRPVSRRRPTGPHPPPAA